jgi:hypothetical protein
VDPDQGVKEKSSCVVKATKASRFALLRTGTLQEEIYYFPNIDLYHSFVG